MTTCTKYPIGSNALWEGHDIFSGVILDYNVLSYLRIWYLISITHRDSATHIKDSEVIKVRFKYQTNDINYFQVEV